MVSDVEGTTVPEILARNPEPGAVYPGEGRAAGAHGFWVFESLGVVRCPLIPLSKRFGRPAEVALSFDLHHHLGPSQRVS